MIEALINKLSELLGDELSFGQMPDAPDSISVANIFGGNSPIHAIGQSLPMVREPGLQIMVRDLDYTKAASKLDKYMETLLNYSGSLNDDYVILGITQSSDILPLGRDKSNRYIFSINMIIKLHRR